MAKLLHQRACSRYVLANKMGDLAIKVCRAAFLATFLTHQKIHLLMQKIINSHSLKMSLRLIVVLLLSFILVNLFQ